MNLFKVLFIIILAYYVFRLLARYILPIILRYLIKRTHGNLHDQSFGQQGNQHKKEGEITIEYIPEKKGKKDQCNDGEYVDYEEIE